MPIMNPTVTPTLDTNAYAAGDALTPKMTS